MVFQMPIYQKSCWIGMKDLILFEWGSSFPKIVEFRAKMGTFLRYFHVIIHQFPILTITIHIEWKISECLFFQNSKRIFVQKPFRRKCVSPGAIIGEGERKRAPFLVLGLAPWYGTIFLFLKQIAPSPAAHALTCCEDFSDAAKEKWRPRFTKSFMLLAHNSTRLCLLEFGLSIFVVSCSSLSEVRQCRI